MVDFYPRPPRGGRLCRIVRRSIGYAFLSTPSARRATRCCQLRWKRVTFLSTPSARRATDPRILLQRARTISIHALREEGDTRSSPARPTRWLISIHALREEGDPASRRMLQPSRIFLSTPSARRATTTHLRSNTHSGFLSTPSARRATLQAVSHSPSISISIHALREEGDSKNRDKSSIFKQIIQHSARI